jgi:hypothetical protein
MVCSLFVAGMLLSAFLPAIVHAQQSSLAVEAWGETYRPAGLVQVESSVKAYPWLSGEAQAWTGKSPNADQGSGDVVVLTVRARDPEGGGEATAGRFVLTTGAVRPVHMDGGYLRGQTRRGFGLEAFGGVPVSTRFQSRSYDWLVGGRAFQRLGSLGTVGASFIERRDHGRQVDQELGCDIALYLLPQFSTAGRASYDLVSRGLSELQITGALGGSQRRVEAFASVRNPSLILPAASLFSVLSNTPSVQGGLSARLRVAPRLMLDALVAYRAAGDEYGIRTKLGGKLWLDDEGTSAVEGVVTRDGVEGSQWTGLRALAYRELIEAFQLSGELELVIADQRTRDSRLWPWGRLSARYLLADAWQFSVGVEGSASPEFVSRFQTLFRVGYTRAPI